MTLIDGVSDLPLNCQVLSISYTLGAMEVGTVTCLHFSHIIFGLLHISGFHYLVNDAKQQTATTVVVTVTLLAQGLLAPKVPLPPWVNPVSSVSCRFPLLPCTSEQLDATFEAEGEQQLVRGLWAYS